YLSPIYLSDGGISECVMLDNHAVLYTEWLDGKYDGRNMEEHANPLSALLGTNSTDNDNDNPEVDETIYYDYTTGQEIFHSGTSDSIHIQDDTSRAQVHFGSFDNDTMEGGEKDDRFYGERGNDTYVFDLTNGGTGIGIDTIVDSQGANTLQLSGITLGTLKPISEGANI